jgi:hypothetical protein
MSNELTLEHAAVSYMYAAVYKSEGHTWATTFSTQRIAWFTDTLQVVGAYTAHDEAGNKRNPDSTHAPVGQSSAQVPSLSNTC